MAGQIIPFFKTLTASGGTVSINTTAANGFQSVAYGGIFRNFTIRSREVDTVFDVKITSPNGIIIWEQEDITYEYMKKIDLTVRGTNTIKIYNSSKADEIFDLEIGFEVGRE